MHLHVCFTSGSFTVIITIANQFVSGITVGQNLVFVVIGKNVNEL